MRTIDLLRATFTLLLLLTMPRGASATSIMLSPWQEVVAKADLIGVLECEVAGETVAKFKVVDSWKAPANGEFVTLSLSYLCTLPEINFSDPEPPLPAPLHGERYLVVAYKSRSIHVPRSTKFFPLPIMSRRIPCDYGAHPFQGFLRTDGDTFNGMLIKAKGDSLPQFKRDVLELVNLPADKQEERLLKMAAETHLEWRKRNSAYQARIESIATLQQTIANADGATEIIGILLTERARSKDPEHDQ